MKYICTACGEDATVAMSDFNGDKNGEKLIGKNERLCLVCAKKRLGFNFFEVKKDAE